SHLARSLGKALRTGALAPGCAAELSLGVLAQGDWGFHTSLLIPRIASVEPRRSGLAGSRCALTRSIVGGVPASKTRHPVTHALGRSDRPNRAVGLGELHREGPGDDRGDRPVVGVARGVELERPRALDCDLVEAMAEVVEQRGGLDVSLVVDDQPDPDL